ncbi:MAG: phosphatase PAP2 family protein [Aeromicrobium erythreum]
MRERLDAIRRWPYTFAVVLSVAVGLTALWSSGVHDVPLRDPEGFLGPAYVRLPLIGLLFFAAGVVPQAIARLGLRPLSNLRKVPAEVRLIVRTEWSWKRLAYITTGLLAFYVCYVSYRNLKSHLPQARDANYDVPLLRLDHLMFFGNNPGPVLHDLLGTTVSAHVLAAIYVAYLPLIPLTLGAFLVWSRDLSRGAWYATALSLNWVLGTVSYYLLPTFGPAFVQPQMYADLAETSAGDLQNALFRSATRFYDDPSGGATYGIAGFASLHTSVVLTACLFFVRTAQRQVVQICGWVFFVATVLATIYFGWHYIVDDIAGALIAWVSVSLAGWATMNGKRWRRPDQAARVDAEREGVAVAA